MARTRSGHRRWSELPPGRRAALTASAALQLGLLAVALRDVLTRPAEELTAPRPLWVAVCFVNVVGPVSYLAFGRRTGRNRVADPAAPGSPAGAVPPVPAGGAT